MRATLFSTRILVRSSATLLLGFMTSYHGAAAQETVTLVQQVNQAPAPPITWNAPQAISFGTPLSALQLNASSAATGTFTYQPASGAMLPPGTNTLSVSFSPVDQNYQTGSASVPIMVVPPGSSSFTITAQNANSTGNPLKLQPGLPATIQLAVAPVGDFHQPVSLSCKLPPTGRICVFSPAVVRPTTGPVQVSLTFASVESANRSSAKLLPPSAPSLPKEVLPGITSSALLGIFLFRRRSQMHNGRLARMALLLMLPVFTMMSGCGSGIHLPVAQIEVQASSLVETRTLPISVVDDGPLLLLQGKPPSLDRTEAR